MSDENLNDSIDSSATRLASDEPVVPPPEKLPARRWYKSRAFIGISIAVALTVVILGTTLGVLFGLGIVSDPLTGSQVPVMNSAWVYDNGNLDLVDSWVEQISDFNNGAINGHEIQALNVYFGSIEAPGDGSLKFYAQLDNEARFQKYASITMVQGLFANIDASLSVSKNDISKVSTQTVTDTANSVAKIICSFPVPLLGASIDFEPYKEPFRQNANLFIKVVNSAMNDNCKRKMITGFFAGAGAVQTNPDLMEALGSTGYISLSGYDLQEGDVLNPKATSPDDYKLVLGSAVNALLNADVAFKVSVPAAASTQEFESAFIALNRTIKGYPQYSNNQPSYLTSAISVLASIKQNMRYKGTTIWTFADKINVKGTAFKPTGAFDTAGAKAYLQQNL